MAADEVIQRTLEQLIFYVLTEKRIAYTSKKDAEMLRNNAQERVVKVKINEA
mgnify:CR=1 FL=1